jgi:hypothetical protein
MNNTKQERYRALVAKVTNSYEAYAPDESNEKLRLCRCEDCQEINLWTYWQGRNQLNADILLVGQDWGSPWDDSAKVTMEQVRLSNRNLPYDYLHNNPSITDDRLIKLFREIGYEVRYPCDGVFFTNFILGYRNKGLSGGYQKAWADHDKGYFQELANIMEPKVILCLARSTFEGVLSAFDVKLRPGIGNYNQFIESRRNPVAVTLENGKTAYVFALAHCGALGTLNRNRGKEKNEDVLAIQKQDWKRIIPYL